METVLLIIGITAVVLLAVLIVLVLKTNNNNQIDEQTLARKISDDVARQQSQLRQELGAQTQNSVGAMGGMLEHRLQGFAAENERSLNDIRDTLEKRLDVIQTDNNRQLEEMRRTVDEKLNKSLDEKFSNSFSLVSQRLEQVYKGLGEMQNLAVGVGDLKKVLSNVKTRGILGEIQLSGILSEILSPSQYEENAATKKGSRNRVEFAVKLPADEGGFIYLPIDSKFPGDTYLALRDAIESDDKAQIEICEKTLLNTIRTEAKDIHDKYIDPPNTTDFAVMACTARSSAAVWLRSCSAGTRSALRVPALWRHCSTPCRWASARSRFRSAAPRSGTFCAALKRSLTALRTCSKRLRRGSIRQTESLIPLSV